MGFWGSQLLEQKRDPIVAKTKSMKKPLHLNPFVNNTTLKAQCHIVNKIRWNNAYYHCAKSINLGKSAARRLHFGFTATSIKMELTWKDLLPFLFVLMTK